MQFMVWLSRVKPFGQRCVEQAIDTRQILSAACSSLTRNWLHAMTSRNPSGSFWTQQH